VAAGVAPGRNASGPTADLTQNPSPTAFGRANLAPFNIFDRTLERERAVRTTGSQGVGVGTRGFIVPIGGAEEKLRDPAILKRFVEICGGRDARIAIIPTASAMADTGHQYEELFRRIGVADAVSLPFDSRADCERADWLEGLRSAHGIFLTGGNQLRLSTTLGGTSVAQVIRERNQAGAHVAGTSAGAAFMSEHMIAFGDEGSTPHADMVTLAPGLGLTHDIIVDQHFRQRDRLGRLLSALSYNPRPIGMGLDEDTAAFISPDDVFEVIGSGAITLLDPSAIEYSSMDSQRRHEPVSVIGMQLHVLIHGGLYDLATREARPGATVAEKS